MNQVVYKISDEPGAPDLRLDLEDGTVVGLEIVLPLLQPGQADQLCQLLTVVGEQFEQSGNYAAACPSYAASVRLAEAADNAFNHSVCLNNLALAYKQQGRYDEAIACYEKAIRLVEHPLPEPAYEQLRPARLASSLCNLAILYQVKGNKERMRNYATWARRIVAGSTDAQSLRVAEECSKMLD